MIELPVRNTLVMYDKRLYHNMKRLNDLFVARCQTTYILGCVATMIRRQNWRAEVDGRMTDCQNSTNWKHLLKQRESYAARPSIMLCVNCLFESLRNVQYIKKCIFAKKNIKTSKYCFVA